MLGVLAGLCAMFVVAIVGERSLAGEHPIPWPLRVVLIGAVVVALAYPCVRAALWTRSHSLEMSRPPFAAGLVILWAAAATVALTVPMYAFLVVLHHWTHTIIDADHAHLTVQAYVKLTGAAPSEYGEITAFARAAAAKGQRLDDFYRPEMPAHGAPIRYTRHDAGTWQVRAEGRNACGAPVSYVARSGQAPRASCSTAEMYAWFYRRVVTGALPPAH